MLNDFIKPRLARLGKIRLGKRAISPKSGNEYPSDLPHFRVPEEVAAATYEDGTIIYGEEPTELDVMVPSADFGEFCTIELQRWGADERKICHSSDGETALRWSDDSGGWEEVACGHQDCPFYGKAKGQGCDERGNLYLILPKVSLGGVYQIDTGSRHGLNNIHNEFETFRTILANLTGCPDLVRGVIFRLTRELQTVHYVEGGERKPVQKYLLHLKAPNLSMEQAQQLAAQYRGQQVPLLGNGAPLPLPEGIAALPQLPPKAELPEPVDECPADLVAGASPVGPDLGQKAAWAALLEQVAEMGKDVGRFERVICSGVAKDATRFEDLAGETEAPQALAIAATAIRGYHAKQQQEQPAPEPQPEPEPEQQQPAATAAKAHPRRTSSKQQQADAPARAADGGSLGF